MISLKFIAFTKGNKEFEILFENLPHPAYEYDSFYVDFYSLEGQLIETSHRTFSINNTYEATGWFRFNQVELNQSYYVRGYTQHPVDGLTSTSLLYVTAHKHDRLPDPIYYLNLTPTETTIELEWSPIENADYYFILLDWREYGATYGNKTVIRGLTPNTEYYVGIATVNSLGMSYYVVKSATTLGANPRPLNFQWDTPKISGQAFNLTATEWNRFTDTINQFRLYKGLVMYPFTVATTTHPFTALMYNETRNAMVDMVPTGLPVYRHQGDIIYADDLNRLVTCLNSIQ